MNKEQFAPFNDDVENNPDKDYITGPYSTFDVELSKMARVKTKTLSDRKAVFETAAQKLSQKKLFEFNIFIGDQFIKLLLQDAMKDRLIEFDSMSNSDRLVFAQDIIDKMSKTIDKTGELIPKIPVVSTDKISIMGFAHDMEDLDSDEIWINLSNSANNKVTLFLRGLLHEFVHMVDHYAPNLGPLGAQISKMSEDNHVDPDEDEKGYFSNPTEINAYLNHVFIPEIVEIIKNLPNDKKEIKVQSRQMHFFTDVKPRD